MKKTIFIKNAAVLTSTGLVLRLFGIIFKIWLTRVIGQAGIGLYQVVFSFYVLASTFATTGIPTAVTRLCGDEAEKGSKKGIKKIIGFSVLLITVLAGLTFSVLFFGAEIISKSILFDLRASFSIKIMGISLPFTGMCSCLRGYFIARRKANAPAISQIFEQIIRILFVFTAIKALNCTRADIVCGIVMLGDAVAEGFSCGFLALAYKKDFSRIADCGKEVLRTKKIAEETRKIALPITAGRYLNSFLRTFENVLVPKNLVLNGSSSNAALSKFGMVKGSALPILFFPSTLLNSMSTLLLPELSVARGKKQSFAVKATVEEVVITTCIVSYMISALFFIYGRELGVLFYKNRSVGLLIRALAPTVPLMYLDSICDGMLKGLNKQNFTFIVSVVDSSLRLLFIVLLVPAFGIWGFVGIMYFSNAFTGFLNIGMLLKTSRAKVNITKFVLLPVCSAVICAMLADTVVSAIIRSNILVYIILVTLVSCGSYFFLVSKLTGLSVLRFFK